MSPQDGRIEIGATLRDARRRYGMEVREVEDRTKIRARYIRALENEDWETLPAPAYVRGFLRTYGQMLGLDGEMLVDEYRRRYGETEAAAGPPPSESPLSARQRSGERRPSRALLIVAVLAGIVVLLLIIGLLGGSDDGGDEQSRQTSQAKRDKQASKAKKQLDKRDKKKGGGLREEDLKLTALTAVEVCLVAGGDTALIDNLLLQPGTKEEFGGDKRYRLTLGPGSVRLVVGDSEKKLEVAEDASFEADSKGIRDIEYRGPGCP
jgi:cytoskeletal protein RodZ